MHHGMRYLNARRVTVDYYSPCLLLQYFKEVLIIVHIPLSRMHRSGKVPSQLTRSPEELTLGIDIYSESGWTENFLFERGIIEECVCVCQKQICGSIASASCSLSFQDGLHTRRRRELLHPSAISFLNIRR